MRSTATACALSERPSAPNGRPGSPRNAVCRAGGPRSRERIPHELMRSILSRTAHRGPRYGPLLLTYNEEKHSMKPIRLEFLLFLCSGMALWAPDSPAAIPVGNGAYPPAPVGEFVGDVTDVQVVDQYERHPGASLIWEPYIAEWKPNHLIAAYGVGIPGKIDMGDIVASISIDDGATWGYPVTVFDHRERQGEIQFAYGNAILYKAPDQNVVWCYAIRCPIAFYHSEDSQLAGAFSADGGRTWTPV